MFEVCKLYFNKRKRYIVFHMFLCCGILFSLFFIISNLWNIREGEKSPFSEYPVGANYVSYAFDEKLGLKNLDYSQLEVQLEREVLNDRIGYVKVDDTIYSQGEAIITIYLNEYMQRFQYKLEEGKWFEDGSKDSIIIGGELSSKYEIGDYISLTRLDGTEYEVCVIGKLPNPYEILLLNCSGEELDYNSLESSNLGNIVITVNSDMLGDEAIVSEEALVVDDLFLNTLNQGVLDSLIITRIDSIGEISDINTKRFDMYLLIAISLCCILYGVYLECKEYPDKLQIFYQMGIDFFELSFIVVVPQFIFWVSSLCVVTLFHLIRMEQAEQKLVLNCISILSVTVFVMFFLSYVVVYQYIRHSWDKIERDIA